MPDTYTRAVLDALLRGEARDKEQVHSLKVQLAKAHGARAIPRDADLLAAARPHERATLVALLRTKPTRTLSGVAIVTVQTDPAWCPHGTCVFCPGGPGWGGGAGTAQAYTGHEPAALRAARAGFDPFVQAQGRLAALERNGHVVDKVELIVQGGTFPARETAYQEAFIQGCLDALNAHGAAPARSADLAEAQARNEAARARCVGLTLETKPDWCTEAHVATMLGLGATRVEVGVQTTHDDVLASSHRGHTTQDSIDATRRLKDAGIKVCYHLMPGLPGSDEARDLAMAERIFGDPDFRPDKLKVYPTLVVPGTALHKLWQAGRYEPIGEERAVRFLVALKQRCPPWVRIMRVDRDIPTHQIAAGPMRTNLRELALAELARQGGRCRCVRCREAGRAPGFDGEGLVLQEIRYEASRGAEWFLSFEDRAGVLGAFLRLREPSSACWVPEAQGALLVRELKVVGLEVPLGQHGEGLQHRGLGRALMDRAEALARERGAARVLVMSGIGVRPYYRKLGYERAGAYMAKRVT
ncbi:MAG TPA: tRNA uridine(34) 5-carboxymethylaminomethyl modification radical SAM/GNAT enzyme Elp3 [Candidatus Thermoplasmatota archaeon]|nr:tRNA uridine(34) 5-carboxymethylaminomethyl modification radical SAM/GNAT enzyme Elp3 [Candidatus Thermoplasmatota archaeon]